MLLLQYLIRGTREQEQKPSIKGIYWFGSADETEMARKGRFVDMRNVSDDWTAVLKAAEGGIAFDTRLCSGPRHGEEGGLEEKVANIRLRGGCQVCGQSPEAREGKQLSRVVTAPVPITSSEIRIACSGEATDVLRCEGCVKNRWCEGCGKWWCEDCLRLQEGGDNKVSSCCCFTSFSYSAAFLPSFLEMAMVGDYD
jgi:hypothetical protein